MPGTKIKIISRIVFLESEFNERFTIYPVTHVALSRTPKGTLIKWKTKNKRVVTKKVFSKIDIVIMFILNHQQKSA
tara:strand:- start:408 stop:635 length:228 start_codon:yes stop_codon:yes gene_type:complete